MSEFAGEKTEQPTPKRLEEAYKHGEFGRSAEVQTVFVMMAALAALSFTGRETWIELARMMAGLLGRLHAVDLRQEHLQHNLAQGVIFLAKCVGPVVGAAALGGLLAGAIQNQFRTSPDAVEANWERLNPMTGLKRIFSIRSVAPGLLATVRLAVIILFTYSEVRSILDDPIFYTTVDVARIAQFLAGSAWRLILRIGGAIALLAAVDYAYQFWRNKKDLMMTREEVKEEAKSTEGNPEIKARQRRLRLRPSLRKTLADVPKADVVVTNPTHLAVALRYDRKTMKAPQVAAKGARLNAQRIREIASQHGVPVIENKPLARLLFKHVKVGGEIPAQLYVAVAEVLAWVYRVNRFRYYTEQNQASSENRALGAQIQPR